jgi:GPH family glycoside/pentoside/hexuronide:cation symporter
MFYVCIRNGAIAYYFKYYVSVDTIFGWDVASAFMVVGTLASILGTGLVTAVARMFGKKNTYIALMLVSTVFTAAFYWVGHDQVVLLFVLYILANLFMGPTSALVWAMYADVADHSEYTTGRRATGLIFSASTMAQKIGWAIGGVITMVILGFVGYDANAIEQTPTAITGIKALISLVPAAVSVLCAIMVFFYALDDKTMEKVQLALAERGKKE